MHLHQQLCPIVLSQYLKRIGINNHAAFSYVGENHELKSTIPGIVLDDVYPAFSAVELGIMLPNDSQTTSYHLKKGGYNARTFGYKYFGMTEAEARAGLLITLIEKGVVTVQDANARLLAA